ncbi:MAG: hypothetical protein ACI9VL_001296, partial [Colwellia sp.]
LIMSSLCRMAIVKSRFNTNIKADDKITAVMTAQYSLS